MNTFQQPGRGLVRRLRRAASLPFVLPLAVFVVMMGLAFAAWDEGTLAGSKNELALLRVAAGLVFAGLVWGLQRSSRRSADAVAARTQELHHSEARFRAMAEAAPIGVYLCNDDGGLIYANPAYFRITGLTLEQAKGNGWVRHLHPEDRPRLAAEFQASRASGRPFHCAARFLRPDGRVADIEARSAAVSGAGGLRGLVGTFEDVGERREFERRLEASERQFRNLFDSMGDSIVVTDTQRRITRTNPAFDEAFGYAEGTLVGSSSVVLYENVEAFEQARERLQRHAEGTTVTAGRFRRSNGEVFEADVRLCPLRDDAGELVGNIAIIRDATEQRAAEAALRQSEAFANAIFDNSPIAMHVFDARGYSLRMNEAQQELLGLPTRDFAVGEFNVLRHGLFERIGLSEKFRRAYEGEVLELPGVQLEVDPHEDAHELGKTDFAYDLTLFPIRDAGGAVQAVVSFTRDISERREAEAARRAAEERLRLVLGNLPLAAFAADAQGLITFAGGRLLETEGLLPEQIVGTPFVTFYASRPGLIAYINRAAAGEEIQADLASNGRYFEFRCSPLRDGSSRPSGLVWVVLDVTASRTAEQARREDQANLAALIENTGDVIWSVSPGYELLSSNAAFQRMVGGMIGHEIANGEPVITPEFSSELQELWRGLYDRSLEGERVIAELEVPTPEGMRFHEVRFNPIRETDGRVLGTTVFSRDVTERRESERALRQSEERYRSTFENLHDAFYQTNMRDDFTMVSPSIETLHGWKMEELIGTKSRDLYVDPRRQDELIAFLEAGQSVNDFEAELWRKDGTSIHVSLNAKLLLSEHGRPYAVQGTSRDISERKRLEAERDRVFNLTVDMLSVVGPGGTLLRVNPAWEATLGYTSSEVLGTNVWDLLHSEDVKRCRKASRAVDNGEVVTDLRGRFRCKDGGWRWLGWSMTRAGEGDVIYCVARDVTELMETQDEMLRVQEELETTIEALRANTVALEEQTAEMDRLRIAAERLANHDTLTGVANRRAWFAEATRVKPTAVAIFDIDLFKKVNDSYGHPAGDEVLREVARRLQSALPETAFLGRLGGEEFAVLFTGPFSEAREASAAATDAVGAAPITLEGSLKIHVTVSGGLAPWRVHGRIREQSLADTYEEADAALYEAKSSGRQQLVVRGPIAA